MPARAAAGPGGDEGILTSLAGSSTMVSLCGVGPRELGDCGQRSALSGLAVRPFLGFVCEVLNALRKAQCRQIWPEL